MNEILKPQIEELRKRLGLSKLRGDVEDRVVYIKRQIDFMNLRLGRYHETSLAQCHAHKVESEHNAKPSVDLSERLRASLSSRNAVHT